MSNFKWCVIHLIFYLCFSDKKYKIMVVWDMALFSLVDSYEHFGGIWYLHLLERRGSYARKNGRCGHMYRGTWKMAAASHWYLPKAAFVMTASSFSVSPPLILPVPVFIYLHFNITQILFLSPFHSFLLCFFFF